MRFYIKYSIFYNLYQILKNILVYNFNNKKRYLTYKKIGHNKIMIKRRLI
jgi:hypothetical protein